MSETVCPNREEDEHWEGAIFLPQTRGEKYFVAKLSGKSKVCSVIESDKIELKSAAKYPVFDMLINSDFVAREWRKRDSAFHAKSKTYSLNV